MSEIVSVYVSRSVSLLDIAKLVDHIGEVAWSEAELSVDAGYDFAIMWLGTDDIWDDDAKRLADSKFGVDQYHSLAINYRRVELIRSVLFAILPHVVSVVDNDLGVTLPGGEFLEWLASEPGQIWWREWR